jgi:hypothetical protein
LSSKASSFAKALSRSASTKLLIKSVKFVAKSSIDVDNSLIESVVVLSFESTLFLTSSI